MGQVRTYLRGEANHPAFGLENCVCPCDFFGEAPLAPYPANMHPGTCNGLGLWRVLDLSDLRRWDNWTTVGKFQRCISSAAVEELEKPVLCQCSLRGFHIMFSKALPR